jgi:hypothetical protein
MTQHIREWKSERLWHGYFSKPDFDLTGRVLVRAESEQAAEEKMQRLDACRAGEEVFVSSRWSYWTPERLIGHRLNAAEEDELDQIIEAQRRQPRA